MIGDKGYCNYCGFKFIYKNEKSIDHIIPTAKGGVNLPCNKTYACKKCNFKKRNYYLEQWLFKLVEAQSKNFKESNEILIENIKTTIENIKPNIRNMVLNDIAYYNYLQSVIQIETIN
jgi:DNA-directed RNA polymerase subunit RPC12/RpoP